MRQSERRGSWIFIHSSWRRDAPILQKTGERDRRDDFRELIRTSDDDIHQ